MLDLHEHIISKIHVEHVQSLLQHAPMRKCLLMDVPELVMSAEVLLLLQVTSNNPVPGRFSILPNNLSILLNVEGFFCTHKIGSYAFTWVCFDRIDEITSVVNSLD